MLVKCNAGNSSTIKNKEIQIRWITKIPSGWNGFIFKIVLVLLNWLTETHPYHFAEQIMQIRRMRRGWVGNRNKSVTASDLNISGWLAVLVLKCSNTQRNDYVIKTLEFQSHSTPSSRLKDYYIKKTNESRTVLKFFYYL